MGFTEDEMIQREQIGGFIDAVLGAEQALLDALKKLELTDPAAKACLRSMGDLTVVRNYFVNLLV